MSYVSTGQAISVGRQALTAYHNKMVEWYGSQYKLSYVQLEAAVQGRNASFYEELGNAVIAAKIGQRRLSEAMERVVERTNISPLTIPGITSFITGVTDEITDFDWSLLGDASLDLAKAVGKKVEAVGDAAGSVVSGVTSTVSVAGKLLPIIFVFVLGVAAMVVFKIGRNAKKVSDLKPV